MNKEKIKCLAKNIQNVKFYEELHILVINYASEESIEQNFKKGSVFESKSSDKLQKAFNDLFR